MNLRKKKIFVTGADGFIGSHLVESLVGKGYDVCAFALYNSFGHWGWLDTLPSAVKRKLDLTAGDIRDAQGVKNAMKGSDVVIHLAALVAIPYSYRVPDSYLDTNVKGTLNVLQAARDLGVEKVVHTSTSEVYGTARFVPMSEDHPLQAQSPYSASKIGADQMALSFHCSFGLPVAVIRPFNTYGPRQSLRAVIPTIITQIASGSRTIRLGALAPTRDFTYVSDTVRGFLAIAESDQSVGEVINIGNGFEISIRETAETVAELMKARIKIVNTAERRRPCESEVDRLLADNSKARKLTGWKPELIGKHGFREGLRRTIRWFADAGNFEKYQGEACNI